MPHLPARRAGLDRFESPAGLLDDLVWIGSADLDVRLHELSELTLRGYLKPPSPPVADDEMYEEAGRRYGTILKRLREHGWNVLRGTELRLVETAGGLLPWRTRMEPEVTLVVRHPTWP